MHHSPYRHSLGAEPVPTTRVPSPPPNWVPGLVTLPTPRVVPKYDPLWSPDSSAWAWMREHHTGTMISPFVPRRFNPMLSTAQAIAQGNAAPRSRLFDAVPGEEERARRGINGMGSGPGLGNPLASALPTIWDATMFGVGAGVGNAAADWLIRQYQPGEMSDSTPTANRTQIRGLGQTAQAIALHSLQTAPMIVAGAAGSGAGWATALIPVIGPIVAGVTIGLSLLWGRKGPKQKVATTQIVDQVEPLLVENRNGYLSGPRTVSSQRQALANFDAGWQFVVEHCDIPEMGDPGQRCVSERQRGGVWDWFARYRDPIANDPEVRADPQTGTVVQTVVVTDPVTGQTTYRQVAVPVAGGGDGMGTLLIAAAVIAAAFLLGGE